MKLIIERQGRDLANYQVYQAQGLLSVDILLYMRIMRRKAGLAVEDLLEIPQDTTAGVD